MPLNISIFCLRLKTMINEYFVNRLIELRQQAGVSAREMSLSLGQSAGYINKIETGQNLPSLTGFFYICEYLNISPKYFFEDEDLSIEIMNILGKLKKLSGKELQALDGVLNVILERDTKSV